MPYDPDERGYRLVYVELPSSLIDLDGVDMDCHCNELAHEYEDLKRFIHETLPDSFARADGVYGLRREFAYSRDSVPLFANDLFALVVDGQGENHHMGFALVVRQDAPAFAIATLDRVANQLFDAMSEYYNLSVRCGPWTSGRYQKSNVA